TIVYHCSSFVFSFYCSPPSLHVHSFPTRRSSDLVIWRLAVILGLYAAAFPLVANFAIDREPSEIVRAWWPVLPLLARTISEGSRDRKSTRLNSSHVAISYAVFCLKKKKKTRIIKH